MRKLAVALLSIVILSLVLTIVGLVIPPVGESLHFIFVKTIGVGLATYLSGAASNALLWASGLGLIGFAIFVLPSIVFGILIAGVVHQLWQKRPAMLGGHQTPTTPSFQGAPQYTPPQVVAPKQEEPKKEEAAPA